MSTHIFFRRSGNIKILLLLLYLSCLIPYYNFHINLEVETEINKAASTLKRKKVDVSYTEKNLNDTASFKNEHFDVQEFESSITTDNPSENNISNIASNRTMLENNRTGLKRSTYSPEIKLKNNLTNNFETKILQYGSKFETKTQCFEIGDSEKVDILGKSIGSAHYCIIDNMCVDDKGTIVFFDDEKVGKEYQFPRIGIEGGKFTRYENTTGETFFKSKREIVLENGLTVLMKHAYCCVHTRHFAEPLPTLLSSLISLRENRTIRNKTGIGADVSIERVILLTKATVISLYSKFMLDSVIQYVVPAQDGIKFGTFKHNKAARCFAKAMVPGSSYLLFHDKNMASTFRNSLFKEIKRNDQFLPPMISIGKKLNTNEAGIVKLERKERIVLVASRKEKRIIFDKEKFYAFLRETARHYGAIVKIIEFGKLLPYQQARNCMNASMLWSIHGNDLTNMMLFQKGSAIVELNPVFFFEPGYYEMAQKLDLHYFSWTCTTPSCAFSGNTTKWDSIFGSRKGFSYNKTTKFIKMKHKETDGYYEPFVYPETGYVGYSCTQCNRMSFDSSISDIYYSKLRESNIKVMPHKDELRKLFHKAAKNLGWDPITGKK